MEFVKKAAKRLKLNKRDSDALHMHFVLSKLGLKVTTKLDRDTFSSVIFDLAELFEDNPKINDLGRWSLSNMLRFRDRHSNAEVIESYLKARYQNTNETLITSVTDEMLTKLLNVILGVGIIPVLSEGSREKLADITTPQHKSIRLNQRSIDSIVSGEIIHKGIVMSKSSMFAVGLTAVRKKDETSGGK